LLGSSSYASEENGTYPLDDSPNDTFRAGRRGEGAHVSVVDAGPAPGDHGVDHAHLLLPFLLVRYYLQVRLQLRAGNIQAFS
jgi:hypothetical protein